MDPIFIAHDWMGPDTDETWLARYMKRNPKPLESHAESSEADPQWPGRTTNPHPDPDLQV